MALYSYVIIIDWELQPQKFILKTAKPAIKTKALQWKKVPDSKVFISGQFLFSISSQLFQISAAPFWSSIVHLDLAQDASTIEAMFAAKESKGVLPSKKGSSSGDSSIDITKLKILDAKKANNVEIMVSLDFFFFFFSFSFFLSFFLFFFFFFFFFFLFFVIFFHV